MSLFHLSKRWDFVSDSTFFLTGMKVVQGGLGELKIRDRQSGNTFRIDYAEGGAGIGFSTIPTKFGNLIAKMIHDSTIKMILAQLPSSEKGGVVVKTLFGDDTEPLSLFDCHGFDVVQFSGSFGISGTLTIYFFYRTGIPKIGPWTEIVFSVGASAGLAGAQALGGVGRILGMEEE